MGVSPLALARSIRDALFLRNAGHIDRVLTNARVASVSSQHYSYLVFAFFALAYFGYYLPQGFTILDDAYLLALGQRISEGQLLYNDFYYLRTPLSPLLQSVWITLLGDNYTILFSRIIWALQLCATVVVFSLLYRRWLSAISLALVLCATLVYSSLLFAFPWYSYDGMFFTALFALFVYRRRTLLAGVFAGLAFLSKQGFIVILPLYVLLDLLETKFAKEPIRNWFARSVRLGGGLVAVVALAGLILPAPLTEIWNNVFVLPERINALPLSFLLYQDLTETFLAVWPSALSLLIVLLAPLKFMVKTVALLIWVIIVWPYLGASAATLPRVLTLVSFAALGWFYLLGLWNARDGARDTQLKEVFKISGLALITLYAAGFNYNGWVFSYIGGALSLPVLVLWSSNWSDVRIRAAGEGEERNVVRWFTPALAFVFLAL